VEVRQYGDQVGKGIFVRNAGLIHCDRGGNGTFTAAASHGIEEIERRIHEPTGRDIDARSAGLKSLYEDRRGKMSVVKRDGVQNRNPPSSD